MNSTGPIIIIDDDRDDQALIKDIFSTLKIENKIECFDDGFQAIEYLKKDEVKPFLILSDINMPALDGLQIRKIVFGNEKLREKCIPYLFLSTSSSVTVIQEAYKHSVQGYFVKPADIHVFTALLKSIYEYWHNAISPTRLINT